MVPGHANCHTLHIRVVGSRHARRKLRADFSHDPCAHPTASIPEIRDLAPRNQHDVYGQGDHLQPFTACVLSLFCAPQLGFGFLMHLMFLHNHSPALEDFIDRTDGPGAYLFFIIFTVHHSLPI